MRLALRSDISIGDKRRMAAERTHQSRKKVTESKIRLAYNSLVSKGHKVTLVAIADLSKLSRQTISKYQYVIDQARDTTTNQSPVVVSIQKNQVADKKPIKNVKYGQHQITAPRRGGGLEVKERGLKCKLVVPNSVRNSVYTNLRL